MENLKEEVESVIDSKKYTEDLKELLRCYINMLNELDSEIWRTMKKMSSGSFDEIEDIDWNALSEDIRSALSQDEHLKCRVVNCFDTETANIYCSAIEARINTLHRDMNTFTLRFGFELK